MFQFKTSDILSSMVLLFISVPLSLGIALASGASLSAGLISAMVGGVVVAAFRSAPLSVSGPAAGLSAYALYVIQQHGWAAMVWVTLFGGLIQIMMGVGQLGKWFEKIPQFVIDATLAAIGFIIVVSQIFIMMDQKIPGAPLISSLDAPFALYKTLQSPGTPSFYALTIAVLCIVVMMLWNHAPGFLAKIPSALIAVFVGTALSRLDVAQGIQKVQLEPLFPAVQTHMDLLLGGGFPPIGALIYFSVGLAIIASAESLITARAVCTMVERKRGQIVKIALNRELIAQGCGNSISALAGGLPVSAVMVRSAANVDAGAQTHWSSILQSLWIFIFVALGPQFLEAIPLSVLSSILIVTGIKLMNYKAFKQTVLVSKVHAGIWILTMAMIIGTDLLIGLGFGIVLSLIHYWKANPRPSKVFQFLAYFIFSVVSVGGSVSFAQDETVKEGRSKLVAELERLTEDRSCRKKSDCVSAGVGWRPCGGSEGFVIYSKWKAKEKDVKTLLTQIEKYDRETKKNAMSICAFQAIPKVTCKNKVWTSAIS